MRFAHQLTAGIAHEQDGAILFAQAVDALVVMHSAVHQLDVATGIKPSQFHRSKQPRDSRRSGDVRAGPSAALHDARRRTGDGRTRSANSGARHARGVYPYHRARPIYSAH